MVVVTPEPGMQAAVGKKLLALAGHPNQVAWVTYPVAGFLVSEELFALFEAENDVKSATIQDPPDPKVTEFTDGTTNLSEAKEMRKRGRPPKVKTEEGN